MSHPTSILRELLSKIESPSIYIKVMGGAILVPMLSYLYSCDSYNCKLDTTVECVYGFYASARQDDGIFVPGSTVSVGDSLTVTILGADTVLVNKWVNQSSLNLPMSYYGDVDSLEFTFLDTEGAEGRDTVYVSKTNRAHLDDPSCPAHMWHTITHITSTHNLIDTILINNPNVNYETKENLQIYFFTAED